MTSKLNTAEVARLKEALAYGMLNLGYFIQARAQQSFSDYPPASEPGNPPAARTGNLRRSLHAVAFNEGRLIGAAGRIPDYAGETQGIGVIVGTNTGYGLFLEVGTVNMKARPFLTPAALEGEQRAEELIRVGAQKRYGKATP